MRGDAHPAPLRHTTTSAVNEARAQTLSYTSLSLTTPKYLVYTIFTKNTTILYIWNDNCNFYLHNNRKKVYFIEFISLQFKPRASKPLFNFYQLINRRITARPTFETYIIKIVGAVGFGCNRVTFSQSCKTISRAYTRVG